MIGNTCSKIWSGLRDLGQSRLCQQLAHAAHAMRAPIWRCSPPPPSPATIARPTLVPPPCRAAAGLAARPPSMVAAFLPRFGTGIEDSGPVGAMDDAVCLVVPLRSDDARLRTGTSVARSAASQRQEWAQATAFRVRRRCAVRSRQVQIQGSFTKYVKIL